MKNRSALFAGILAGLAAPGSALATTSYPRLEGQDLTRLRGDVERVGLDFSNVIAREKNGKSKGNKSK
jgi:hypothetical protein